MSHADYNFFAVALSCDKPDMAAAAKKTVEALDNHSFFSKEAYAAISEWIEICKKGNENFYGSFLRQMLTVIESFNILSAICGGSDEAKAAVAKIEQIVSESAVETKIETGASEAAEGTEGTENDGIKPAEGLAAEEKTQ